MGIVYLTTNLINGKRYIGSDIHSRPAKKYVGSGTAITRAIKKYGIHNFSKIVLEEVEDDALLRIREQEWIKRFDAVNDPLFYNLTTCTTTRLGSTLYEDTRRKISEKIKALETKSCQFCDKFFSPGMYSRWHGDRCKSNPARDPSEPWVVAARESSKRSGKLNRGVKRGPEARKNLAEGARKGWKTRKGS